MQNCKWTAKLATLGIAVIVLAGSLAPSKAQAQQHFAYATHTNGVTRKYGIAGNVHGRDRLDLSYEKTIAEILVPENANIGYINVWGCVNLTNIVLQPARPLKDSDTALLTIFAGNTGLRTITCKQTMRDLTVIQLGARRFHAGRWGAEWAVQWVDLELPKMEIRTHATANGPELEIIWRGSNLQIADLQIADAINGKWKDYNGNSPLRIPLWLAKPQQFFRIRKGDE